MIEQFLFKDKQKISMSDNEAEMDTETFGPLTRAQLVKYMHEEEDKENILEEFSKVLKSIPRKLVSHRPIQFTSAVFLLIPPDRDSTSGHARDKRPELQEKLPKQGIENPQPRNRSTRCCPLREARFCRLPLETWVRSSFDC